MQIHDIAHYLRSNSYPGRGIIIGKNENCALIAYFIMGRSQNSRNRVFVEADGGIRTQAYDPSKLADPSLIIYAPVRTLGSTTIVTNGDQTDTIYNALATQHSFAHALRERTYEPDAPNYTPRISGMAEIKDGNFSYKLSILKSNENTESVQRFFYEYPQPIAGEGHFLHTYRGDGDPLPSFEGEPVRVCLRGAIEQFSDMLWNNLDPQNRVSLFVRTIDLYSGVCQTKIINKNG